MSKLPETDPRNEDIVPESAETALMPVDWSFDAGKLKSMTPEERLAYDIEQTEKLHRLYAAQQELARILTAADINYEGESPRTLIDKIHNPDQYQTT